MLYLVSFRCEQLNHNNYYSFTFLAKTNMQTKASFVAAISIGFNMEAYTFIGLASASFYPDTITLVNNDGVVSEQALLSRLQLLMQTMI